jgi:hypothetical protein
MTDSTRYAIVAARRTAVDPYLPAGYVTVVESDTDGQPRTLIAGQDIAGWTLDDYVLPRLASGLHFGEEIHPPDWVRALVSAVLPQTVES